MKDHKIEVSTKKIFVAMLVATMILRALCAAAE